MISPKEWLKQRKYCPGCETYKLTSEFTVDHHNKVGLTCYCKTCRNGRAKVYQKENPEQRIQSKRRYRYRGYTEEHGKIMSCEICSVDLVAGNKGSNTQHIDHDHKTGIIRGVLCKSCNTGLGLFKDNPEILREAARYLEERTS